MPAETSWPAAEFDKGSEFTVGVEEELMLVDDQNQLLGHQAAPLTERLCLRQSDHGRFTTEVYVDQIELVTKVCRDADEIAGALRSLRTSVLESGGRPMAAGLHPDAGFGDACLVSSPRYDRIIAEYAGLFRTPTAATQVHVGLPDADAALSAYRGLRNRLPLLRALAAASPYWHGRDSGMASARSAVIRSYPRTTVPPVLHSWEQYAELTSTILTAAEAPDYTYVWWDLRPQPRLGTLEIRVMDAQPSLDRVAGLTALIQGLARHAVESPETVDLPVEVLAENDFRAAHHGLDARVLDPDGLIRPMREIAVRAVLDARRALADDGLDAALDEVDAMLVSPSEAVRQRLLYRQHGMAALLADVVARTAGDAR
jgi:carboxylate-amine ligase